MVSLELRLLSFLETHFEGEARVRVSLVMEKLAKDEDLISSIRQVFERDPLLSLRAFTSMYISAGDFLSLMNSSNEHALSFIDGSIVDDSSESSTRRRRVHTVDSIDDDDEVLEGFPQASKITASYRGVVHIEERKIMSEVLGVVDGDVVDEDVEEKEEDDADVKDNADEDNPDKESKIAKRTEIKEETKETKESKDKEIMSERRQRLVSDPSIMKFAASAVRAASNNEDPYEKQEEKQEEKRREELSPLLPPLNIEVVENNNNNNETPSPSHIVEATENYIIESTEIPPHFIVIDDEEEEEEEVDEDENESTILSPLSQQRNRVERAYRFIFDVASKHVRSSRLNFKEISRVFTHPVFHVRMEDLSDLLEEHDFVFNLEFFSLMDHEENDALSFQDAVSGTMFALRLRQVFVSSGVYEGTDEVANLAMASNLCEEILNDKCLIDGLKRRDAYPIVLVLKRLVDVMGAKSATISYDDFLNSIRIPFLQANQWADFELELEERCAMRNTPLGSPSRDMFVVDDPEKMPEAPPPVPPRNNGSPFWALVRSIFDALTEREDETVAVNDLDIALKQNEPRLAEIGRMEWSGPQGLLRCYPSVFRRWAPRGYAKTATLLEALKVDIETRHVWSLAPTREPGAMTRYAHTGAGVWHQGKKRGKDLRFALSHYICEAGHERLVKRIERLTGRSAHSAISDAKYYSEKDFACKINRPSRWRHHF